MMMGPKAVTCVRSKQAIPIRYLDYNNKFHFASVFLYIAANIPTIVNSWVHATMMSLLRHYVTN